MAISVKQLFKKVNLESAGCKKWGKPIGADFSGVYIIASTNDIESEISNGFNFSLDNSVFDSWKKKCPELTINDEKIKNISHLTKHLNDFWHKEENIFYIGSSSSTTTNLSNRVNDFYTHKVGDKGPHYGGFWLKLLSNHSETYIHYAKSSNPIEHEFKMIMCFAEAISGKSFYSVDNLAKYFPFANLKVDLVKEHLLGNTKKKKSK